MPMRETLHIVLHFNPDTPWFRDVFPGITTYVEEQGNWEIGFLNPDRDLKSFGKVHGVLSTRGRFDPEFRKIPRVNINQSAKPYVMSDNHKAGALACEHLLQRGYRHLLFYQTDNLGEVNAFVREQGFRDAARSVDKPVTTFTGGAHARRDGAWRLDRQLSDLSRLLAELPKPIGALTCNPEYAQRLYRACQMAELRIPEDIGVICPTDSTVILPFLNPSMSSVQHDRFQIGYQAAQMLDRLIQGESVPDKTLIPPKGIIVRCSTDHRVVGDPLCDKIVTYIWDHLEDAPTTAELASRFHLSERTLYRRFRDHVGRTPSEELRHARIETAKQLLRNSSTSYINIALECGYGGQSQFNRDFKRATGMTPGDMRRGA
jgi:LacI family transcriptional regulator